MEQYLIDLSIILISAIILSAFVLFVLFIIWLLFKKFAPNKSKYTLLFMAVVTVYISIMIIPIVLDLHNGTILKEDDVIFVRSKNILKHSENEPITIYFSDGSSKLCRILLWLDDFPFGEYRGSVVYTKYSRIILDYSLY